MRTRHTHLVLSAAAAAVFLLNSNGQASTYNWTGGSSSNSNWGTPENWSAGGPPTGADTANFAATAAAPAQTPFFVNAEVVGRIVVDNSGGYAWQLLPATGSTARTVQINGVDIGGGVIEGLNVSGGGTTSLQPVSVNFNGAQQVNIGANTTVNFFSGTGTQGTIIGTGLTTKTGGGTLVLPTAGSTKTGGWLILDGTVANGRSSNGMGVAGSNVTVGDSGTYEIRNATTTGFTTTLKNGGTLLGTGTATLGGGSSGVDTITVDSAAGTSVSIKTASSGDIFNVTRGLAGGAADSLVTFDGPGTINVYDGYGNSYLGNYKLAGGTLVLGASLQGSSGGVVTTTPLGGGSHVLEVAGGNVKLAGSTNSGSTPSVISGVSYNVTGDATFSLDKLGSAGTAVSNSNPAQVSYLARTIGAVTLGGGKTLTVNTTSNITGSSVSGQPVRIGTSSLNLSGNATVNVTKPSGFALEFRAGSLTGAGNLTVDGTGQVAVTNASSTYSGAVKVKNGATLLVQNEGGLGTGSLSVDAGGTGLFANGLTSWTVKNDLSGGGTVQFEGGTTAGNLAGAAVAPGGAGTSGILTVAGKIAFAQDGSELSGLNIDVTGGNAIAGTDFDQLAIGGSATLAGLSNANLLVKIAPGVTQAALAGDVLTIVSASGTNFAGANFANVTGGIVNLVGMGTAQVNYNNGSITLSNIAVPEPASLAVIGLIAGGVLRRRRNA